MDRSTLLKSIRKDQKQIPKGLKYGGVPVKQKDETEEEYQKRLKRYRAAQKKILKNNKRIPEGLRYGGSN